MITSERVSELEQGYQRWHQVEGVTFVTHKDASTGIRYATDNDNALYTGMALAAAAYRYAVKPESVANYRAVMNALDGIELLTTVSGIDGVLARWVFPLQDSWERIGYDRVRSVEVDNWWAQHIEAGQLYERGPYAFMTKTTRDQLSGVLFGLTVADALVPMARSAVKPIVHTLALRFAETDWSLKDHEGKTGTSAHKLDAPLKLIVQALHAKTQNRERVKSSCWFKWVWLMTAHYNRKIQSTYSYNLNMMDAHSLLLLQEWHSNLKGVQRWHEKLWKMVKRDNNPHFATLNLVATGRGLSPEAIQNLERRAYDRYRKFFSWSKDPKDWWHEESDKIGPSIDVLLPYWMKEYYEWQITQRELPF